MWIIVRTQKGKNNYMVGSGEWTKDRSEAEQFDKFDMAVTFRDRLVVARERRGVGVVKMD